jgi:hypothetical protein
MSGARRDERIGHWLADCDREVRLHRWLGIAGGGLVAALCGVLVALSIGSL